MILKFKYFYTIFYTVFIAFFILLTILLLTNSLKMHFNSQSSLSSATELKGFYYTIGDKTGEFDISKNFEIAPNTPFTITTEIQAGVYDSILVKTVYTKLKLYADDILIYECGKDGSYPDWMLDPPTLLKIISLPNNTTTLRFEYVSPSQRNIVSIPSIMAGDEYNIIMSVLKKNSALLIISIIMLFMGIGISIISLPSLFKNTGTKSFFWLGLFSFSVGCWGVGECNATALLIPYPSLLYCIACIGLFTLSLPLLQYGMIVLAPKNPLLMKSSAMIIRIAVIVVLLLQITGITSFSKTLFIFHFLTPLGLATFVVTTIWEHFKNHNIHARRFAIPSVILFLAAVMEVLNYSIRITNILSFFFLTGTLIFTFTLGIIGIQYMTETIREAEEKKQLESEISFMNQQISMQREYFAGITEHVNNTKKTAHDIRHQLAVIKRYNNMGSIEKLNEYLDEISTGIPLIDEQILCENFAVNAVLAYYINIANNNNIPVNIKIYIPENTGHVPASDLCVIMGNLLENAIEACLKMISGNKFINVRTQIDGNSLSVCVTNSFDGLWLEKEGKYLSRKQINDINDNTNVHEGIGISSVKAICEKYDGLSKTSINGNVWKASALVNME